MTLDESTRQWIHNDLLDRFLRYVQVHTTSNAESDTCPSTAGQRVLAEVLYAELKAFGLSECVLTNDGYVFARIPACKALAKAVKPTIGFLAHLDTSPDCSGENVRPRVHSAWDGSVLKLSEGVIIDPQEFPALKRFVGRTIITSDGTTLLGADDKAGVAEIMSAVRWLTLHPEFVHGELEVIFTPDEEIGRGVDRIPRDHMRSSVCYTLDGGEEGTYNARCFNAWAITVTFRGRMIHPGSARGKLVNALTMASTFMTMVPRAESPETTDGEAGYYCLQSIQGSMEETILKLFIRDFEIDGIDRRLNFLQHLSQTVEKAFPGGTVELSERRQYLNMAEGLAARPESVELLKKAISAAGIQPVEELVRGGTDGSRLTEIGIPTPNIFAGGHNFHSLSEWVPLESMERAASVILNLVSLWAE